MLHKLFYVGRAPLLDPFRQMLLLQALMNKGPTEDVFLINEDEDRLVFGEDRIILKKATA